MMFLNSNTDCEAEEYGVEYENVYMNVYVSLSLGGLSFVKKVSNESHQKN